ncbi:MAG: prepilin peptidase [Patescibacteria group bacterium]|nr:prepilin peptidase [Patescibacteria group bacterium]MDW8279738.1 prepilin peptidase [bacterium]
MIYIILFLFGASLGSFINVLSLRYKEDKFILSREIIGGRSHCRNCKKILKWYELIPILSFIFQSGKCRHCKTKLIWQYFWVELICGLIPILTFIYFQNNLITFFPKTISNFFYFWSFILIWDLILLTLVLISLIDLKLKIIPNETIIFLIILGIALNLLIVYNWNEFYSFLGQYNSFFGDFTNFKENRLIAFIFALLFFGGIILVTLGQGMGMGDLKLMIALSIIFGWPETLIISILSFILGGIVSLILILKYKTNLKGILPFGPFIVISSFLTLFLGKQILEFYFYIMNFFN